MYCVLCIVYAPVGVRPWVRRVKSESYGVGDSGLCVAAYVRMSRELLPSLGRLDWTGLDSMREKGGLGRIREK